MSSILVEAYEDAKKNDEIQNMRNELDHKIKIVNAILSFEAQFGEHFKKEDERVHMIALRMEEIFELERKLYA